MKTLLEIRNRLKLKKPTFIRHDAHKKARVGSKWRRPKGRQNKMRLHMKGYSRGRSTGFGSPLEVKGLSREGFIQNVISTVKDLETLNPKIDGIIISRTLGLKKKQLVANEAVKKGFTLLNLNEKKLNDKVSSIIADKKKTRELINKRKASKEKLAKQSDKKSEVKDSKKETVSDDKKIQEKKEHDKILTKKGEQQ